MESIIMSTNLVDGHFITITKKYGKIAEQIAMKQDGKEKISQAYHNVLASAAVKQFLEKIDYSVDIDQSDSFKPSQQHLYDTGHLKIKNLDVDLECCPILLNQTEMIVPEKVTNNADFYIAVAFEEYSSEVQLLGFCPISALSIIPEGYGTIPIQELTAIDELIFELAKIEEQQFILENKAQTLSQYLEQKAQNLISQIKNYNLSSQLAYFISSFEEVQKMEVNTRNKIKSFENAISELMGLPNNSENLSFSITRKQNSSDSFDNDFNNFVRDLYRNLEKWQKNQIKLEENIRT